jgi:nicastrin
VLQGFQGAVHYAELQTTMQAAHNSSACIAAGACLPLGSHSVWCAI